MARLASGEIGIIQNGREFLFRPSFRALDDLHQRVSAFELWDSVQRDSVHAARIILDGFYVGNPDEINDLIGYTDAVAGIEIDRAGDIPNAELCVLAFAVLRNALQGKQGVKVANGDDSSPIQELEVMDYVWSAHKNLNLSLDESWNLTMAEFLSGMIATYPDNIVDTERENAKTEALMKQVYGDG